MEALTGKWPAQHSEELKRGITIRLGYADATFYKCSKCGAYSTSKKCPKCFATTKIQRTVSFVDAPGHESLMATVLTGSALIDGALLVIAANEKCPMPQTREHLKALELVGIKNIIVIQNKIDLVDKKRIKENYDEIKNFLKGTIAEKSPVIPISAQQRINIEYVIQAIEEFIPTPKRDPNKDPTILVARSFDVNKPGTEASKLVGGVLGGSVVEGKLRVRDEIEIRPGAKIGDKYKSIFTRVVSLQKAGINLQEVGPGGLVGILTELDPYLTKADTLAGNVVGLVGKLPPVVYNLRIRAHLLERLIGTKEMQEVKPLKLDETLMVNVGTGRSIGIITSIKKGYVEIELKIPVCVRKGERIVVSRQVMGRWRLIGYGEVI